MNNGQQAAVEAISNGHVAVVAGPGTGKTHTLINAVMNRLEEVPANDILVLTFTNKAADELKTRLKKARQKKLPMVTTFHGWAYRQIEDQLQDKKLVDSFTQRSSLQELKKQTGSKHTTRELGLIISRCKNGSNQSPKSLALVKAYDELLSRNNLIDFDDLLRLYIEQKDHKPDYQYIFVDEFQDTSPLQYQLLRRITLDDTKLFVIGDPNQSIYGFRGAHGEAFNSFIADYQPARVELKDNYRSAEAIISASAGLFPDVSQKAVSKKSGTVRIVETLDIFSEADYIIRTIEHALGGTDWSVVHHDEYILPAENFQDFAVLYRNNRQGQKLAERLRGAGLPAQITGEDSPYATPLAQAVLAIFIYLHNPNEEAKKQVEIASRTLGTEIPIAWLDTLDSSQFPAELAKTIAEHLTQMDKVASFQSVLNGLSHQPNLETAVSYWQNLAEQEFYDPKADCITLSTIHASKGLEFRHVFVAGCNEGILPHKTAAAQGSMDEEKRLLYVAITRAIESLTLLHCQKLDGKKSEQSRFLAELPDIAVRETDDQLTEIKNRRARSRQKRSQQSLF